MKKSEYFEKKKLLQKLLKSQNRIRKLKIFFFLFGFFLLVVFVGNLSTDEYFFKKNVVNSPIDINGPNCGNLSFQKTAICLNDYVRKIYIYNVTDDDIDLSLEDLKKRGGDCRDWTNFYLKHIELYGYTRDNQIIKGFVEKEGDISYYHVSLMAFDVTGYCHFDLENLECYQYRNESGGVRT